MPSAFVEACAFKYVSYITNILLSESLLLEHGWFSVIWEVWEVVVVWQVQKKKKTELNLPFFYTSCLPMYTEIF